MNPLPQETQDFIETENIRDWVTMIDRNTVTTTPFEATSAHIAKTYNDIKEGKSNGEYPVVEDIIKKHDYRDAKIKHEEELYEQIYGEKPEYSEDPEPQRQVLISDVKPTPKERIYSLERDMQDVNKDLTRLENAVTRFDERSANREDVYALEQRLKEKTEHAHLRIDRDVMPEIKRLSNRRVFKDIVLIISLSVSILVNVVVLYHYVVNR